MKRLVILLIAMVFLVSCAQEHPGAELERFLVERFEEGDRMVTAEELVEPPWDSLWLVDKTREDMVLPQDLEGLEDSEKVRVVAVKEGEIHVLDLPDTVEFKYLDFVIVSAFQLYNDTEFLIDRVEDKLRLYYQEDCNV